MPNNSIEDLLKALLSFSLWWRLAFLLIIQRYRRSMLGPFWITISSGFFIFALTFIMQNIFNKDFDKLIAPITFGIVTWAFIFAVITESCESFYSSAGYIKNIIMPLSSHIFITLFKNIIIFFHNSILIIFVLIFFGTVNFNLLFIIPGFIILTIILFFIALTLAILCARFRDLQPIVYSITQIFFFITPIWWSAEIFIDRIIFIDFNPFYHFVYLIKSPLLGNEINISTIIFIILFFLLFVPLAFYLFSKTYKKIAYWV
jgi:ABC-type polysaccharide/polyol phosphate export permease